MNDANENYLKWLNDPEILRHRGPKAYPSNMEDLLSFIKHAQSSKDLCLAICLKKTGKENRLAGLHPTNYGSFLEARKVFWNGWLNLVKNGYELIHPVRTLIHRALGQRNV